MKRSVAFGKLTLGLTDSAAQHVTNSGAKMKAKADLIIPVKIPQNLPAEPPVKCSTKAPGCFQKWKPKTPLESGAPPKKITIPTMIKPTIQKILIEAIQNSTSPKNLTAKKFKITVEK
ncbi:unnamed protein product [[Candida] boidinii]|nr:unnamed protein product [[Candida] boidinii]